MGLDLTIGLTPYIKIKKIRSIDIPKVKRVCPTHTSFIVRSEKFCPNCGTEIVNQEYIERQELHPHQVFQAAGLEDDNLFTIEYLEGVLKPNQRPPHSFPIEEQQNQAHNLLESRNVMLEQVEWFEDKYFEYISALNEAYGPENIEVCWGLLHYWH